MASTAWLNFFLMSVLLSFIQAGPIDNLLLRKADYLESVRHDLEVTMKDRTLKAKKKSQPPPKEGVLYVARAYPEWQALLLDLLAHKIAENGGEGLDFEKLVEPKKTLGAVLKADILQEALNEPAIQALGNKKATSNRVMGFVAECIKRYPVLGSIVLEKQLPFEEIDVLNVNASLYLPLICSVYLCLCRAISFFLCGVVPYAFLRPLFIFKFCPCTLSCVLGLI